LNGLAGYAADLTGSIRRGWNAFFFTPGDPTALGLIRIATGLLAFWSLFVFGLDLFDYFGADGWANPEVVRLFQGERQPLAWSFWFSVSDAWLRPVWLVCLAILALYAAGLFSRVTAVLAWVIVVSTVRRVPIALFGFDQIVSMLTLYVAATGASGQAVSLDRFIGRLRRARESAARLDGGRGDVGRLESGVPAPTVSANLALRLIQLHLVLIYGMAGMAKLQGPSWWNGTALWGTLTAAEFVTADFTFLAAYPLVINVLTHVSLAIEVLYPILIWVRVARPLMLAAVVALHLGIAAMSPGLTEFALAMIAANLAFVSGRWLRSLATGLDQPSARVLYDGACPRCRASIALVAAADPDHVIEPIDLTAVDVASVDPRLTPEACMKAMHVVWPEGAISVGFDAVRGLAGRLPLFWPLALVGHLPGVAWAGRRIYDRIAAARPRDLPCDDAACGVRAARSPVSTKVRDHSRSPDGATPSPAASPADRGRQPPAPQHR
jgi:predicted DCC family thiol-disulfide oxidoreductase YuxK